MIRTPTQNKVILILKKATVESFSIKITLKLISNEMSVFTLCVEFLLQFCIVPFKYICLTQFTN